MMALKIKNDILRVLSCEPAAADGAIKLSLGVVKPSVDNTVDTVWACDSPRTGDESGVTAE